MDLRKRKFVLIIFSFLLFLIVLFGLVYWDYQKSKDLVFIAFDVGEGDALFFRTPYHQNILIDGGPDNSIITHLSKGLSFYDRTIDLMVLTHPDADHSTGLVEVLKRYKVRKVLYTGVLNTNPSYLAWLKEVKKEGISSEIAQKGMVLKLGKDLRIEVFSPENSFLNQKVEDTNDTSIVLKVIYGQTSFLLMGDASQKIEKRMISEGLNLKADVLKISHHGSDTATGEKFLQLVQPKYAVISVGGKSKKHPHPQLIRSLKEKKIIILRTDKDGDIRLRSDGVKVKID